MKIKGLSQIIAVQIKNLLSLSIGMDIGHVTILIPFLTDGTEGIQLTSSQTSWMSSIISISSLIGSLLSGAITEPFGRKRAMMALTIPFFIPWIGFNMAREYWHICVCLFVHGLTNGLVEAPVLAYVAEISEPRLRGMLSGSNTLVVGLGVFIEFFLGSLLPWRTANFVSCAIPILALFLLSILPESPYWLIKHNQNDKARQSLAWLRDWTTIENIEEEFQYLQKILNRKLVGVCNVLLEDDSGGVTQFINCESAPTRWQTLNRYINKSFLWPFSLVFFLFTLYGFIGSLTLQTYGVVIFSSFKVPINKYHAAVLMGAVEFLGSLICIFVVRFSGKRIMALISISVVCICNILLGIYSFCNNILYLNFGTVINSYSGDINWIPLLLLVLTAFMSHCGAKNLPWMLIGELFSNDTRGVGCGLSTSANYLSGFAANKLYISMVLTLSLPGVFCVYSCICIIGLLVVYFALPETEGKALEEIANHFNGRKKLSNKVNRKAVNCNRLNKDT